MDNCSGLAYRSRTSRLGRWEELVPMSSRRVAVVTGAGSGIGRAVALALAENGWAVILAGRRVDALTSVAQLGIDFAGELSPVPTDVTIESSVKSLFDHGVQLYGRIDLLFNNAGTFGQAQLIDRLLLRDWTAVVDANLTGSFLCTREAFRVMRYQTPRGGRIINNGSISAQSPRPMSVAYTVTKHALTGLTKATAIDGRKYDIACGQIDIGNAATEMTTDIEQGVIQPDGDVRPEPRIDLSAVTRGVLYMAELPLDINVASMTVLATKMPFIGRG